MTAASWTVLAVVLLGCVAYAASVSADHGRLACLRRTLAVRLVIAALILTIPAARAIGRTRAAILRARWAWRCRRRLPMPERDPLDRDDMRAFLSIVEHWHHPAPPERTRT